MASSQFFHGLSPRWLGGDRLYRIYASNEMLAGAYIAGQLYDERVAATQLQQFGFFLWPLVRRVIRKREKRESVYDATDPFSSQLVALDNRNFQITRREVVRTRLNRRRSMWTPYNSGTIEIELAEGTTSRFILVGDQDTEEVLKLVQGFDPTVESVGEAKPLRERKPLTPRQRRFVLGALTTMVFAFGVFFAVVAAVGANLAQSAFYAVIAAVNIGVAIWVLAGRRKSQGHADSDVDG